MIHQPDRKKQQKLVTLSTSGPGTPFTLLRCDIRYKADHSTKTFFLSQIRHVKMDTDVDILYSPFGKTDRPPACGPNNVQEHSISQQCFRRKEIMLHVYFHLWFHEVLDLLDRQVIVLIYFPLGILCCL